MVVSATASITDKANAKNIPVFAAEDGQMKAGLLMGLESPTGQAERMARALAIWGRVPDAAEVAERIDAVTVAQIRDHARKLLENARPALALYGPVGGAPGVEEILKGLAA